MIAPSPNRDAQWRLTTQLWLPVSRDALFPFFADAFQLETITPPWLHFQVVTPAPIVMAQGTLIDYKLRIHQIPVRWRTLISVWEPPYRFVDEQLRGPYSLWKHEHRFIEQDGGTLIEDLVDYSVFGGSLIHRWLVKGDLERIFNYREQTLRNIFAPQGAQSERALESSS